MDDDPFSRLAPSWRAAFELAWESWRAGSLGIGAVLVDSGDAVVARGRNRVLEEPGSGRIAGTLLAHAEMDAFTGLGLRTAAGLTLYTTVEPCLMCASTSVALRLDRVRFATADPVFDGVGDALAAHPYCAGRVPEPQALDDPVLAAVARVLPHAARVWSKPGRPPHPEWVTAHAADWAAAVEAVGSGLLPGLAASAAPVDEVVARLRPLLAAGAL
jgi:tRNA(adenine34) deaminase